MSQITLQLDEATRALVDRAAVARGMSKNRWVAEIIRKNAAYEWPKKCLDLAGRFADFPLQSEANVSGETADIPKLSF